jgi:hypothetical protein
VTRTNKNDPRNMPNLAKALSLDVSPKLLAIADEVIE